MFWVTSSDILSSYAQEANEISQYLNSHYYQMLNIIQTVDVEGKSPWCEIEEMQLKYILQNGC